MVTKRKTQLISDPQPVSGVESGSEEYPAPPYPIVPGEVLGSEEVLDPSPRYRVQDYQGSSKLQDMVAIITGANAAVAHAVAVLFAREGADLALVYEDEHDNARQTQAAVLAEGRRCILISGDVKDASFCEEAVEQTLEEYGKLDILVNHAGDQNPVEAIAELTSMQFELTVGAGLLGYFHMAKAALPYLGVGSSIINTGSETGVFGNGLLLVHSATNGAIHAFSKALSSQVVEQGIRVNVVAPGPVMPRPNAADRSAGRLGELAGKTAMRRAARPEEIAPAYVFLAAPSCSSYITGIVLPVMGGVTGSSD